MSALPQSSLDDEERRLATLGRYGVLDTPPEQAFDDLTRLQGAAFDRAYIKGQIDDHTKVAQMLEYQLANGKDPQLKAFAAETLPTVRHHLELAQSLQTRVLMSQR